MAKKLEDYKIEAEALGLNTESLTTITALKEAIKTAKANAGDNKPATPAKQVILDDAIAEAEKVLTDLKAEKLKAELEAKRLEKAEAAKNDKRPTYKAGNGLVFRFKTTAPKTLNIEGAPQKITDIIKDKEVMAELVSGRSNFIEPVN